MKLTLRGSKFYLVKRVPSRFSSVEPRKQVWISLQTDSRTEAFRRASEVSLDLENQWLAKVSGGFSDKKRIASLSSIAETRGFQYLPADKVALQSIQEILSRVSFAQENMVVTEAVLGSDKTPKHRLSDIADLYLKLVEIDVQDKGRDQRRVWENTIKRCTKRFVVAVGDKCIEDLSREDMLVFRNHWVNRIKVEGVTTTTANRELTALSGIFSKLYKLKGIGDPELFRNLAFARNRKHRLPYHEDYIRDHILPALETGSLNNVATDIMKILINTGLRSSEVTGLSAEDIFLNAEVPYVSIRPRKGRELKTKTSIRDIPVVGIALEAAKRHPDGFFRYFDKTSSMCQTMNKFLKVNGLRPTTTHSVYSFRHGFQDRLTAVEAPDRLQADLMGHSYVRERYGLGPSLAQKSEWLSRIGFF